MATTGGQAIRGYSQPTVLSPVINITAGKSSGSAGQLNPTTPNTSIQTNNPVTGTPTGNSGDSGGVATSGTNQLPKIYFNFKKFNYNNSGLKFKFSTDSLNSGSANTNTWACDPAISSGSSSLSGDTGCLRPVNAYGKYFYELEDGKSIKNDNFLMLPSLNPNYTILVFAIGNTNNIDENEMWKNFATLMNTNSIHRFIDKAAINNPNIKIYNFFSWNQYIASGINRIQVPIAKSVFSGGVLNSTEFINSVPYADPSFIRQNPGITVINPNESFATTIDRRNLEGRGPSIQSLLNVYNLYPYNSYNLPTNLANPSTSVPFVVNRNGGTTDYQNFALFFVEMRCHTKPLSRGGNTDQQVTTIFETYINGIKTSYAEGANYFGEGFDTTPYSISLSNKKADGTSTGNQLFLFDYLYGTAYNKSEMEIKSRATIHNLVSKYKNLLIKQQTGDLKIADGNQKLKFPLYHAHPFFNLYLP